MKKIVIAILSLIAFKGSSQNHALTIGQAMEAALRNNAGIQASQHEVEARRQLQKTSFDLPKTDIRLVYGQYNSDIRNDNNISISQSIPFSVLGSQGSLNRAMTQASELQSKVTAHEVTYQVKQVFYQLVYAKARHSLLQRLDSIYEGFLKSASSRYRTGETNLLEQTTAASQRNQVVNKIQQNQAQITKLRWQLKTLIHAPDLPDISAAALKEIPSAGMPDTVAYRANPALFYQAQQVEVARREKKLQSARFAPGLSVGFFSQTLIGMPHSDQGAVATKSDRFTGFEVGLSIPLWFTPHQGRVRAAEFNIRAAQSHFTYFQETLRGELQQATQQLNAHKESLEYYVNSALPNAALILRQSQIAFREGEIGYVEYLMGIQNAISMEEQYLTTLNDYNQSIIYIDYLTGKP